jgi:predicted ArsR family transcriptional regulator
MEQRQGPARHLDGARVHRALSSPVRTRLLWMLLDPEATSEVRSLAPALGLHVNTVRAHLAVLEEAGLVRSEPEARDRPGRPRLVYRPTESAREVVEPSAVAGVSAERGYRFLAQVLAGQLAASSEDPAREASEAGVAWGRYLVERPAPFEQVDAADAIDRVLTLLRGFGFEPELTAGDERPHVLLHRCPFHEVAKEQAEVVCSIHLGLMRGALEELGADVGVRDLRPFVRPDLCVTELEIGSRASE